MRKFLTIVFSVVLITAILFGVGYIMNIIYLPSVLLEPRAVIEATVTLDSTTYEVGDEIKLNVSVWRGDFTDKQIADEDVFIKLEKSPYYEIVGDDEFVITDFDDPKYMRGKNTPESEKSATFVFTIKITDPTIKEQDILIKAKFTPTEYYRPSAGAYPDTNYNSDDEYFYHFRKIDFKVNGTVVEFERTEYYIYV